MKIFVSYFLLFNLCVFADVEDSVNISYQEVKTKHASKKDGECNIYIEINGNEDWDEKKDELNTIIDNFTPQTSHPSD